jgi:hypothetical protein
MAPMVGFLFFKERCVQRKNGGRQEKMLCRVFLAPMDGSNGFRRIRSVVDVSDS